ncbi:MAG: MerR family DNA-binding transcriptional regulator [Paracoccaceae bacterium]
MADDRLTIRQMCDLFGVTPRTLRFYESKELLFPDRIGQRRLFTRRDRARTTLILRGKRFGFTLEEIRQLLDLYDTRNGPLRQIGAAMAIARERLAELRSRRKEISDAIVDLEALMDSGDEYLEGLEKKPDARKK